ncbi:MAG: hypothetical protein LBJ48_00560 [Coriobacteriales bacterium]|jgi:hypothetical protein|nr:hypothetical protein [Coriobacteriales bacterium]
MNRKQNTRKSAFAVALIVLLGLQGALAPAAFADISTPIMNPDGTLTVEQTYLQTETAERFPRVITYEGREYRFDTLISKQDPGYERPKQSYTRTLFSQVPVEGLDNWAAYFPAMHAIEDGDFQGEIGLDTTTPFSYVERYHSYRVEVDKTVDITDLPDNDYTRIPTAKTFEVVSETTPGETQENVLQLLKAEYELTGLDSLGLPNDFTAHVTYRGQEGSHDLAWYDVTAHYTGELESGVGQTLTTAFYSPVPAEVAPIVEEAAPLAESEFPFAELALAITGATVVVFLAVPLLYFFLLTNARLLRVVEKGTETGTKEVTELICRRRLVLRDGVAEFRIPSEVDIFGGEDFYLTIKPRIADREGELMLTWQGRTVAVLPLARHVDINFRELLTASVEAILVETDLLD